MYDSIYKFMNKYEKHLISSISKREKELSKLPEGALQCHNTRGYYTWRRVFVQDGHTTREVIHKDKRKLAENLAYRAYIEQILSVERRRLKAVQAFLRYYPFTEPGADYIEACPEHKELLRNKFTKFKYTQEQLDWMYEEPMNPHPNSSGRIVPTVLDYKVRSKSESDYVSCLVKRGIVFRYEWPLFMQDTGQFVYPDFTIIHPITGETIYIEHFGEMDKDSYVDNNANRMYHYFKSGILPGRNLFCSYETLNEKFTAIDANAVLDRILGI